MMTETLSPRTLAILGIPSPHRLIIHHRDHGLAALEAAGRLGITPTLQTPSQGVFTLGIGYLTALEASLRSATPDTPFHFVIDCGDAAGYALAALRSGSRLLVFRGDSVVATKLQDIAEGTNAQIIEAEQHALDLWLEANPLQAAMRWLSEHQHLNTKNLE